MQHAESNNTDVGICTTNFPRIRVVGIRPSCPISIGDRLIFRPPVIPGGKT